jgi:Fe-S oxidoreductase
MTHLAPAIYLSLFKILKKAGIEYNFMDADGSICCGRPLMLSGDFKGASQLIDKNKDIILNSGCTTLLLSCHICYKVFREEYILQGIEVVHHSVYINYLLNSGKLRLTEFMKVLYFTILRTWKRI